MKVRLRSVCMMVTALLVTAVLFAGCGLLPFFARFADNETWMSVLSFDLTDARALAGTASTSRSLAGSSRALSETDEAALVKILEDGSVASAIDFGDNANWAPNVAFMYVGEDGSAYVGFEYSYQFYFDSESIEVQLVRIYPDSTDYEVIWPVRGESTQDMGVIDTWGAAWMNQDPMVVGPDENLYFKTTSWGTNVRTDHIYRYDPKNADAPAERVTPDGVTLTISQFAIDSQGHLFVQSEAWDNGSANYLRFYTDGQNGFETIYYSSTSDIWVRGFVNPPDGNSVILNGENIRGMSGIIRADISGLEVTYELLYESGVDQINFSYIGQMVWSESQALYALYDPAWWVNGDSNTMVIKLLDSSGNPDLTVVPLVHSGQKPSLIYMNGDELYYRYAILDGTSQETGIHRLARFNIETSAEVEIFPASVPDLEILSFDVADDDSVVYFLGLDPQTNAAVTGRIDVASGTWEKLDSSLRLSNIKIIE